MAKKTLLELTQAILNDMDGDQVNSISDTIESEQVVQIIHDTFDEIISSRTWPHLNQLISLTPQGAIRPTHMDTSPTWTYIDFIKYNKISQSGIKKVYDDVFFMYQKEFLDLINQRNSSLTNIDTILDPGSTIDLLIVNDKAPEFWTTFDDDIIIFDSYDNLVDSNLQESKCQVFGNVEPTWTQADGFTPDLPAKAFAYLLAEAKSTASNTMRQVANQKEEQKSRRQRTWLGQEKWRINGGIRFPDYGRNTSLKSGRSTKLRSD
jgi:hypothetical protein